MSNIKENLIKAVLIFAGGGLLYYAFRPTAANAASTTATTNTTATNAAAFDSEIKKDTPEPTIDNAKIVADAYEAALQNGEPPSKLTELNQECMKEFGMRCYVKDNMLFVCDVSGNTVLTK